MRAIQSACLVLLLLAPVAASAQTYRCVTPGGSYFSDRPREVEGLRELERSYNARCLSR